MTAPTPEPFAIRPYRPADRAAVRTICAATAWMGEPAPERIGDEWLWAEFWTGYFTDRRSELCWVVESAGRVVGYLTGTSDVREFDRHVLRRLPALAARVVRARLLARPQSRRAILGLARSLLRRELSLPAGVARDFPATFHVDLLPQARRRGLGSRLLAIYLDAMAALGVAGVHGQALADNEPVSRCLAKAGFRTVGRSRLRAFVHIDRRAVDVLTWVKSL